MLRTGCLVDRSIDRVDNGPTTALHAIHHKSPSRVRSFPFPPLPPKLPLSPVLAPKPAIRGAQNQTSDPIPSVLPSSLSSATPPPPRCSPPCWVAVTSECRSSPTLLPLPTSIPSSTVRSIDRLHSAWIHAPVAVALGFAAGIESVGRAVREAGDGWCGRRSKRSAYPTSSS